MSIVIDLKSEVKRSADLHFLEAMLGALAGQRCLKVELSYGEELMLHLGAAVPYSNTKLADETKGSWILGTRASRWSLFLSQPPLLIASNGQPLAQATNGATPETPPEEVEKKADPLIGCTVVVVKLEWPLSQASAGGVGLVLEFSDGSRLTVLPDDEADNKTPLADWELFTPYDMYLTCGPGPVWSYARSDVLKSV
jgi:hypothetical protein